MLLIKRNKLSFILISFCTTEKNKALYVCFEQKFYSKGPKLPSWRMTPSCFFKPAPWLDTPHSSKSVQKASALMTSRVIGLERCALIHRH